jgi:hypothetical protein
MRLLMILLIGVLTTCDILGRNFGLGPGLSLKNAMLYVLALSLFFRFALAGGIRIRLAVINVCFAVWIGYALITWLIAAVLIQYHGYEAIQSAIALKSTLIDSALFFFTVFYGVREEKDFRIVMKALAVALCVASVASLTDVTGITHFGVQIGNQGGETDRLFGAFGHANETGALMVCLLPAVAAIAASTYGVRRMLWYASAATSLAVLILTVSRGAFLGMFVGYAAAAYICRRFVSVSRMLAWGVAGVLVVGLVIGLLTMMLPETASLLANRVFGHSASFDVGEISSGRTVIWAMAIDRMMSYPVTLLTGFGWNAYSVMPFIYALHNQYLDQWFNLGVIGVAVLVIILGYSVLVARRAAEVSEPPMRNYMVAFVFGMLALMVAIFFCGLSKPWPYIWIYTGLSLRGALICLDGARAPQESVVSSAPSAAPAAPVTARALRIPVGDHRHPA